MKKQSMLMALCMVSFNGCSATNYRAFIEELPQTERVKSSVRSLLMQAQEPFEKKNLNSARVLYQQVVDREPQNFIANLRLGKIATANKEYDQAKTHLQVAFNNRPPEERQLLDLCNALLALGNDFFNTHQTMRALDMFRLILQVSDQIPAVHHNIAFTLAEQTGDHAQALNHYKKALALNAPNNIETHFCYSMSLLATGDLLNGFKEYEYRWYRPEEGCPRKFKYPLERMWTGDEQVLGKRIFITVEQGLGDTLHFIRYARELKALGAYVIVEVQKPLKLLARQCPYIDEVIAIGEPIPAFDMQIPMLNLPSAFKTTLSSIPKAVPYMFPDSYLNALWRTKLQQDTNVKVGICWQGDPSHAASKFMPLAYFEQLAAVPGVSLYSLQKSEKQSPLNHPTIIEFEALDEAHGRFMDTTAIINNLDLIITVDTSIAHLAGALGKPTWVILPYPAEWRWLMNRDDSPWYPTMRLFRQNEYERWDSVLAALIAELSTLAGNHRDS